MENLVAWSNLPGDVLREIFRKLNFIERFRTGVVCKNWMVVASSLSIDKLPWLLTFDSKNITSSWELKDATLDQPYTLKIESHSEDLKAFKNSRIHASRKSWLLMEGYIGDNKYMYMYNPFKRKTMKLPRILDSAASYVATFSEIPGSLNFTVFVSKIKLDGMNDILTWQCGDADWSSYSFDSSIGHCFKVAYCNSKVYCLLQNRYNFCHMLGAFDIVHKKPCIIASMKSIDVHLRVNQMYEFLPTEGDILLMVGSRSVCAPYTYEGFRVFKLEQQAWCEEKELGNRIAYVNSWGSIADAYSTLTEGETRKLANRIYYNYGGYILFYCMKKGRICLCSAPPLPEKETLRYFWIQLPELMQIGSSS